MRVLHMLKETPGDVAAASATRAPPNERLGRRIQEMPFKACDYRCYGHTVSSILSP
jgi:hypothetical protein